MGSDILLLVSDSNEDAVSLQLAVDDGHSVLVAADAAQCVQLANHSPCLILVSDKINDDFQTLCGEIRKHPFCMFAPIVLLADPCAAPDLADADGVLTRPVEAGELRAWLQAAQRLTQLRQQMSGNNGGKSSHELLVCFSRLSHAVNNPLQALYATVDMLLLNHGLSPEAAALTSEIITHAGRVAKIVAEASSDAKKALQTGVPQKPSQVS